MNSGIAQTNESGATDLDSMGPMPGAPMTMFAWAGAFYKTTNGGMTWVAMTLPGGYATDFAIDTTGERFYLGSGGVDAEGPQISTTSDPTWKQSSLGLRNAAVW